MNNIMGILLIIAGLLIMTTGQVSIGLGVGTKLENPMNYIIALPEILLGIYILYINNRSKGSKHEN